MEYCSQICNQLGGLKCIPYLVLKECFVKFQSFVKSILILAVGRQLDVISNTMLHLIPDQGHSFRINMLIQFPLPGGDSTFLPAASTCLLGKYYSDEMISSFTGLSI